MTFLSTFRELHDSRPLPFPDFTGERIMMMPIRLGSLRDVPDQYWPVLVRMFGSVERQFEHQVGYLTIDERKLEPGETLRRPGKHVDGYYHGRSGAWGGGGGWGSVGNGMITASSTAHCKAYPGLIEGVPGDEGECEHLKMPNEGYLFKANTAYWVDGACVHESLPVAEPTQRQFVRLSMPNNGPWFEGYTPNPRGLKPTGEILPRREFMS